MNRFAALLDRLAYEPRRNARIRLVTDYFALTPDPDRGWALAAMTGALSFVHAKPGLIRALIAERTDPVLFALSYDYVGDLSETVALMWPAPGTRPRPACTAPSPSVGAGHAQLSAPVSVPVSAPAPTLGEVVETLRAAAKLDLPRLIAHWLDGLDETGRWALLKLMTGGLRIGVSARLAKTAVARLGQLETDAIEEVWHGLEPPYQDLFRSAEGHSARPEAGHPAPFRPPMLAHPVDEEDFTRLDPADFAAEWKWDGIRVQAVAGRRSDGHRVARLYSRSGEDLSQAFPDLLNHLDFDGAINGELLILRDRRVQSFNVLQQRLNRKSVTAKLLSQFPAHIRAYDLIVDEGRDIRGLPFHDRRRRLEAFVGRLADPAVDLSPLIAFPTWDALAAARADPAAAGAGDDAEAVEGCMIKRADSPYLPGRPKGLWFKWKRQPFLVDAVLMYAQRGHGKRSSYYSDYTFGVWREAGPDAGGGDELVPVGKAYFGFTDAELIDIDRFVRRHTTNRFGPVREVAHGEDLGLVFEVAFEGLQRSTRHKSGIAMRFPRINRIRWDKPPREADRIAFLERLIAASGPAA